MFEEEKEEPASVIVQNIRGEGYDIKNIPGIKRQQLINSGDISIESFVQADNVPGAKLQKLRDRFKKSNNLEADTKSDTKPKTPIDINKLEVGSLVMYKKIVTEVKKIDLTKGRVLVNNKENKGVWVPVESLKEVNTPSDDNDEE